MKTHVSWLEVVKTLNPSTLLPIDSGPPKHDCLEVMDEVFLSQPDLTNQPIGNPNPDGRSFVLVGTRFVGYAVVTSDLPTASRDFCTKG
jgi:hypothetical protein